MRLKNIPVFISLLVIYCGVVNYFSLADCLHNILDLQHKKFFELSDLLLFFLPLFWLFGTLILLGFFVSLFKEAIYEDLEFTISDYIKGYSWDSINLFIKLVISVIMGIISGILHQSLVFGLFISCVGSCVFSFEITWYALRQTFIKWYNA